MTETASPEPSFADAAAAIERANELPVQTSAHWLCSLRQIAQMIGRPMDCILARWTSARHAVGRLHYARVGANPKTLANHKSNVRAALQWFGKTEAVPSRGTALTPEWHGLRKRLPGLRARSVLSSLMRYCSARQIAPTAVDEAVLDDYMRYRAETTALATDGAARRAIARVWNGCIGGVDGWPANRLVEPAIKTTEGPAWEEFPEELRTDVESHLKGLAEIRRINGKRRRPCKPSTIRTRRLELKAAARIAVRIGIPIESLTSLKVLIHPDVAGQVIDAYWKANGAEPRTYTIDLAARFVTIARQIGLDAAALERLEDMRAVLDEYRQGGMTEKNLAVIRQILSGAIWPEVVNLPTKLMAEARSLKAFAPVKAAVTAQMAVAIAILTFAPVRLGNLARIRLDENRPGRAGSTVPTSWCSRATM
jgi:hypothetical protein